MDNANSNFSTHARPATPDEITLLNEIAFRSKAHWGYTPTQMEAWRADLAISAQWIEQQQVHVAIANAKVAGFCAIVQDSPKQWRLEHLWVEPNAMGRGVGRLLLRCAAQVARSFGAADLMIDADPNAVAFYKACGALRVGEKPAPIEGAPTRTLPVFRLELAP